MQVCKKKVLLLTHITMGYGSPEMLNLYKILESYGFEVYISDQEDERRSYYELKGYNRFFRKNLKKLNKKDAEVHYAEMVNFSNKFMPDIVITSFPNFILDEKFMFNKAKVKILYAAEVFPVKSGTSIDGIIAPNEDRLKILTKELCNINTFTIYNAPLLSEMNYRKPVCFDNPSVLNVLYQGQISKLSGVDIMLKSLEYSDNIFLHLCGDIRDESLRELVYKLEKQKKLNYYGFLKQLELDQIRKLCHVGFIGWREDLDINDITIKYCCPTKLYDYISYGMPVVYIKNTALDKWNNIYG
ncbi:MAG: hypothetical protein EOM50_23085, partial [Erysipelotrichia bacterium]|nr:hypothetical protein [Erysipelotrichia bacterium]